MKTVYDVRDYTFGQETLKLRTAISLTQERLATYLGVSGRAVRGWEAGVSYPKAEHLKALIALAVQQQAFTVGHESEEIRVFWKAARPKMLLDEDWLCTLLEHSSSLQDKETVGADRGKPCPVPGADPLPCVDPVPNAYGVEDGVGTRHDQYNAERTLSMKTVYDVRDYTFGQEMLKLRTAISLTQERLATYLGVSGRAVRGWEAGVSYPKAEHLKALIALAVQQQAFTVGHESEEIRVFWKVARPKMLLDEDWLYTLLEHSSSPQDKKTAGVVPYVDPEPPPSAHPLSPLPSMPSVEDGTSSTTPTTSQPLESGTTGVPWPGVEDELVQGDGSVLWNELVRRNELMQGDGSAQGTIPTVGKTGGQRRLLIPILIALVLVAIIASAGTLFFYVRAGTTTQVNKTVTDQAYPGYLSGKGTLAFFDPLSQESGSKWSSHGSTDRGCQFTGSTYHVSTQQHIDYFRWCLADGIFGNFAIAVQLTITQGDCGGITFRDDSNDNFYKFTICQYGTYFVDKYMSASSPIALRTSNSSAIRSGLGQQNKIAVVASGSTMTFYVNERQVDQVNDSNYNSGKIALIASPRYSHVTDVAYSNAKLWRL